MFDASQIRIPLIWKEYDVVTPDSPGTRINNAQIQRTPQKSAFSFFQKVTEVEEKRHSEFPITIELMPMKKKPIQRSNSILLNKQYKPQNIMYTQSSTNHLKLDAIVDQKKHAGKGIQWHREESSRVKRKSSSSKQDYFVVDIGALQEFFDNHELQLELERNPAKYYPDPIDLSDHKNKQLYLLTVRLYKLKEMGGIHGLQNFLRTNIKNGLDRRNKFDLAQRKQSFGSNIQPPFIINTVWEIFISLCKKDKIFLVIMTLLSIILLLVVINKHLQTNIVKYLVAAMSAFLMIYYKALVKHNYSKQIIAHQSQINNKNKALQKSINVIRSGKNALIESRSLLVGDILIFRQGDLIQCDGILTKQYDSDSIKISQPQVDVVEQVGEKGVYDFTNCYEMKDPFIFAGSQIIEGDGEMIVLAVGERTSSYHTFQLNLIEKQVIKNNLKIKPVSMMQDPFGYKIHYVTVKEGKKYLFLVVTLVLVLLIRLINNQEHKLLIQSIITCLDFMLYGIILMVMMVPTNIVQILNLYMINVIQIVRDRQVMVEDYIALYWLGQVNELIVDKTGCLTKSEMKVGALYCETNLFEDPITYKNNVTTVISERALRLLFENICINSKGVLITQQPEDQKRHISPNTRKNFTYQGSRNEFAMLKFAQTFEFEYQTYRPSAQIQKIFPFKSRIKRMITLYQISDTQLRVFFKGSPDFILQYCNYTFLKGQIVDLSQYELKQINQNMVYFGQDKYMKTICLAYKDLNDFKSETELKEFVSTVQHENQRLLSSLIFIALVGIQDPIRPDSYQSVQSLIQAQINVRLFTGDNVQTAISSAKACGILKQNDNKEQAVIEGDAFQQIIESAGKFKFKSRRALKPTLDFKKVTNSPQSQFYGIMDRQHLAETLSAIKVIAKASSTDKELILSSLKLFNRIVCLTGDDAENALAVEQAHVGVGLGGSETKSSIRTANVVLLDDSISGIRECVAQGRGVFFAMSQLVYAYVNSSAALYLFCLGAAIMEENPIVLTLPILMMLNIFMNYLSLFTLLRLNSSIKNIVMLQPPYSHKDSLLNNRQIKQLWFTLVLFIIECILVISLGWYHDIHQACSGIVLLIHLEGIGQQVNSYAAKLVGSLLGFLMVIFQWTWANIEHQQNNLIEQEPSFFIASKAYWLSFLVVQLNSLFVVLYDKCLND